MVLLQTFKHSVSELYNFYQKDNQKTPSSEIIEQCIFKSTILPTLGSRRNVCNKIWQEFDAVSPKKVSLCKLQQIVCKACFNVPYQQLLTHFETQWLDVRLLFDYDYEYGGSSSLTEDKIRHDYPDKFKQFKFLNEWRDLWELSPNSTQKRAFLCPPLPLSIFGKTGLSIKKNWSWKAECQDSNLTNKPQMGFLIYRDGLLEGGMMWSLWGVDHATEGTDFYAVIHKDNTVYRISYDLRPNKLSFTRGPIIDTLRYNTKSFISDALVTKGHTGKECLMKLECNIINLDRRCDDIDCCLPGKI